jgi:hypothetical protein
MRALITFLFISVLTACASAPKVFSDFDSTNDFSDYKTFAWISDEPAHIQSDYVVSPFIINAVKEAIVVELTNKGYTLDNNAKNPDFLVAFTIGARDKIRVIQSIEPFYDIDRWTWGHQFYSSPRLRTKDNVHQYVEGILSIDMFDGTRKVPVWHGYGEKRLNSEQKKGTASQVPSAVKQIIESFPAQTNS